MIVRHRISLANQTRSLSLPVRIRFRKPAVQSIRRGVTTLLLAATILIGAMNQPVLAQHEGHSMPGMSKSKAKVKPRRRAKRRVSASRHRKRGSVGSRSSQPVAKPHVHELHAEAAITPPALPSSTHTHEADMSKPAAQSGPMPTPKATPHVHPNGVQTEPRAPAQQMPSQHETHTHPAPATTAEPAPSPDRAAPAVHAGHTGHTENPHAGEAGMENSLMMMSENDMGVRVGDNAKNMMPMGQMGSGTSWQPSSTQTNMLHQTSGEWLLMFHYNLFVGVNSQGGRRGVTKFESANWFMPMAFRRVGPGTLELRGMFSFEPFTFPRGGSPLLFQTGETYKGQPIVDAQHPHDLVMELSASYTVPLGDRSTWFVYGGYPGEPALGPTAFMHRASASENPAPALSHHLQDSSHITFGVLTTGFTYRWFKLEGSVFNGREPDENRYDFEAHQWNSRSVRLSFAPNRNWSMQLSHGFLRNPEALDPGDVRRTTASISYNKQMSRGYWATSVIWGRNHESHGGEIFHLNGYVGESTINFLDQNYLYTRLELVDKNALLRAVDRQLLGITDHHPSFRIGAYTLGGARDFYATDKVRLALGGDLTFHSKPDELDVIYGNAPVSYRMFLRVRPGKMSH
jgi:hypothetical protein